MKKFLKILVPIMLILTLLLSVAGCGGKNKPTEPSSEAQTEEITTGQEETTPEETTPEETTPEEVIARDGSYTSKEDVALYLITYGELPGNFITKDEAKELGWDNRKGNLWDVAPGMSIGGDKFGNYEGLLPKANGRKYYECDIDYEGGYRNEKRIIFSNDGLIFYTDDHYESFEQLYGED
ncbi:MAG: ribonuclease [Lachnospiraceae bacterium]|nr:ribonuclease [Lachnospiraceae bacterium]